MVCLCWNCRSSSHGQQKGKSWRGCQKFIKAKPSIDLGDGASDEVDEDELEELWKEKNYK